MPEFLKLTAPTEALQTLLANLPATQPEAELVDLLQAVGRVSVEDIQAGEPLPAFPRSTMDGYAVRAADTFGASESIPAYLFLCGEVPMGAPSGLNLEHGQAALIHTGGMLPTNADAVVALEQTQPSRADEIEVLKAVAKGENTLAVGEDVRTGQIVIARGKRIGPAEVGGCMALGILQIKTALKPRIGVISSGDEVVPPERKPEPGQVRDVNSFSLAALVRDAGGEPVLYGIVGDNLEAMKDCARQALDECQAVIITAGSSASARDMTAEAIASLGTPGVLVHGVNVRPGKPTILAVCQGKAVIGLPGNPVSALVIAGLFVRPVVKRLLGMKVGVPVAACVARLILNVASQAGREDWVPVRLIPAAGDEKAGEAWLAEPIFAKSNLIFSLVAADGLICIPPDVTGLETGEQVHVRLFA
jgi:molybdopterin molybdotransferase